MSIDCNRCGASFDSMDHLSDHLMEVHDAFTDVVRGAIEPTVSIELPLRDVVDFANAAI
ncbi:hypothetical protein HUG10_19680 (plasmid) [Halorarum halophilum]|uniref:C2H2-type domain-containing protein n=1 Tax=Halorarum halophilum TaxID=2743090 RepID=A0A7D5KAE3_9EURY|nr:hypothetical protein [Halobaculum halophilum]QLG29834.1 hypothetical protein HUG10_19680 [Halobaculum halophilum]